MSKVLYVRPGAKDYSGNPVGFKAEEGSASALALQAQGFVPEADAELDAEEQARQELMRQTIAQLKAMATQQGIDLPEGANRKSDIVEAILAVQEAPEQEGA